MSTSDSTIFVLNQVGTAIWQGADGATSLSRIVDERVCAEFEIAREEALADAREFVEQLAGHGILAVGERPLPRTEAR